MFPVSWNITWWQIGDTMDSRSNIHPTLQPAQRLEETKTEIDWFINLLCRIWNKPKHYLKNIFIFLFISKTRNINKYSDMTYTLRDQSRLYNVISVMILLIVLVLPCLFDLKIPGMTNIERRDKFLYNLGSSTIKSQTSINDLWLASFDIWHLVEMVTYYLQTVAA